MSDPDNPYAAPRSALEGPSESTAPLPEGVRRYRLDPARSAALVGRRLFFVFGFVFLVALAPLLPGLMSPADSRLPEWLAVGVIGGLAAASFVRVRYAAKRALPAFELLVGPRVLRRVSAAVSPAEVLRPEVTSIVELGAGLWLCSERPARALLVPKSLEGYDGLRADLVTWAPVASVTGWASLVRASKLLPQQGLREEVAGTALAADPSLAHELEAVRNASSDAWRAFPQPNGRRRLLTLLALWAVLILLFAGVWLALQSSSPPRPSVEEVR